MSQVPDKLRYTSSHEWVRNEEPGVVVIGITDHAQSQLGDIVYVDLPEVGTTFESGDDAAVVESVKTAADVYAPLAGEVIEVNDELVDTPDLLNREPYAKGWLFKLKLNDENELTALLDAAAYQQAIAEE